MRPAAPVTGNVAMFDKRTDLVRFIAVADTGKIAATAERLAITQPTLTRDIARLEHRFGGTLFERLPHGARPPPAARRPTPPPPPPRTTPRLEHRFGGRLFERLPHGVRLTALGVAVAERARRVLRELQAADEAVDAVRAGRSGVLRVTANPPWTETVLAPAAARFHDAFPQIELRLATATRAEGLRRLADGATDLHCGGIDGDEPLPEFLRRERFLDMTAGVVASSGHPLLGSKVTRRDLSRYPWIDFDWPATPPPGDGRPSLGALLEGLGETVPARVRTSLRADTAGLLLMANGPYLAWLSLTFLDCLPGGFLQPLPVRFGRFRYRTGFVARRSAEDLAPLRGLEAIVREIALLHRE